MAQSGIYFFIGTEAELIKLFPVMLQLQAQQVPYHIIASGQNDIVKSTILRALNGGHVDLELSKESDIKKSAAGLMQWFAATWHKGKKAIPAHFGRDNLRGATMVVHGDTVSTVMGAYLAKHFGMRVAHVEAGLRSHNWLNPFPEEIDRVLTSRCVRLHFAPGQEAAANLSKAKGLVVNTTYCRQPCLLPHDSLQGPSYRRIAERSLLCVCHAPAGESCQQNVGARYAVPRAATG